MQQNWLALAIDDKGIHEAIIVIVANRKAATYDWFKLADTAGGISVLEALSSHVLHKENGLRVRGRLIDIRDVVLNVAIR
jgi:hypothetical protein